VKEFSYYDSNTDSYLTPEEPGWYVAYKTESGESDVVKISREPKNLADAQSILEVVADWEWEGGEFFAQAMNYGYIGENDEE